MTVYVGPGKYPFYFHKGRLCQYSSFFEKAFHGSFEEATTGSMYLEEDGVDEFRSFEEWLYLGKFNCPNDCDDLSLLLVKVYCFADRVGISDLQNASLDAIRSQATEQHISLVDSSPNYDTYAKPQSTLNFAQPQFSCFHEDEPIPPSPPPEEPVAKHLLPATANAIRYAYQNTLGDSSLRKLLADIFAFNVKPESLNEEISLLSPEFMADVLFINMRRLPFRLGEEEADFDRNADKYHVLNSSNTPNDRKQRVFEDMGACDGLLEEAAAINEDNAGAAKSSSRKGKKKKKRDLVEESIA